MLKWLRIIGMGIALVSVGGVTGGSAKAATPACGAATEGVILFDSDRKIVVYCNGSTWMMMGGMFGSADTLSGLSCANGEIAKWNGTAWACAADEAGMSSLPALTSARIWVGNGSNAATAVAMSGDATLSNAGVLTIANNAIGSAEITDGSIANADLAGSIALSKLSITGTGSASNFLRGDGSWQAVPSGADNLGNHTATANLNMQGNWIQMSNSGTNRLSLEAQSGFYRTAFDRLTFWDHGAGADIAELNDAVGSTGVAGIALKRPSWNALMMDGNGSTKSLVMHYGGDADNNLRFGKYADNFGGWEANVALLDIDNGNFWTAGNIATTSTIESVDHMQRDSNGNDGKWSAITNWDNTLYFQRRAAGGGWEANLAWLSLTDGTLTATKFVGDGSALTNIGLPAGAVMPFNLSACPSGWTPLAGAAGRVIVGVGSNGTNTYALGNSGGADLRTLTVAQMPSHTHSVDPPSTNTNSAGNHNHVLNTQFTVDSNAAMGSDNPLAGNDNNGRYNVTQWGNTDTTGAHTHAVDISSFNSGSAGSGSAFDNRSAYYALLYCQKL